MTRSSGSISRFSRRSGRAGRDEIIPTLIEWIGYHRRILVGGYVSPAEPWGLDADYVPLEDDREEKPAPRPP